MRGCETNVRPSGLGTCRLPIFIGSDHVKTKAVWVIAVLWGAFLCTQDRAPAAEHADQTKASSGKTAGTAKSAPPARADADAAKDASKRGTAAATTKNGGHPPTTAFERAVDPTVIRTPPPPPVKERIPPPPGADYIWVPGHYVPIERVWTWTAGKWTVPPDSKAIWIEGRYDVQTQRWTAGYWQPGDPSPQNPSPK